MKQDNKGKVYSASLKKMQKLKLLHIASQNNIDHKDIQKLQSQKKFAFKQLMNMKKKLYNTYQNSKQFQHKIDQLVEKVTIEAQIPFEQPLRKKQKYKNYRIFTQPSTPTKKKKLISQMFPPIHKKKLSAQKPKKIKQITQTKKDFYKAMNKLIVKKGQFQLAQQQYETKYIVKPTLKHYRQGTQSLKKFQKLKF